MKLEALFSTNGFTNIKKLSQGSFGSVYSLKNEKGKMVAAKVLLTEDAESRKDFITEIQLLKRCKHPGIIEVFISKVSNSNRSKSIEDSNCFFTLELAKVDLKKRYEKNKAEEKSARHIFSQIVAALSYLHSKKKIIHHDIKPDNILLMSTDLLPVAKLTDFGLSRTFSEMKKSPLENGTHGYFAPEVLKLRSNNNKKGSCDEKIDIFALGISLLEVSTELSGMLDTEDEDDIKSIERGSSALLPKLLEKEKSKDFVDFFRICVAFDVKKRAGAKQLLEHPWLTLEAVGTIKPTGGFVPKEKETSKGKKTKAIKKKKQGKAAGKKASKMKKKKAKLTLVGLTAKPMTLRKRNRLQPLPEVEESQVEDMELQVTI